MSTLFVICSLFLGIVLVMWAVIVFLIVKNIKLENKADLAVRELYKLNDQVDSWLVDFEPVLDVEVTCNRKDNIVKMEPKKGKPTEPVPPNKKA